MGQRVQDGFANAYIGTGPAGHPVLTEVLLARPMQFLTWSDEDMAILSEYGFIDGVLPANSYNGQTEDIRQPASLNNMIVNASVDDEVVYQVTKAVVENIDQLVASNSAFRDWDVERYIQPEYQVIPLHPGAERYYRERGWLE